MESSPESHTLLLVDSEGVRLYPDVVVQPLLDCEEVQPRRLGLRDLLVEEDDGVVDDGDLVDQPEVRGVVAGLYIRPVATLLQSGLGNLHKYIYKYYINTKTN